MEDESGRVDGVLPWRSRVVLEVDSMRLLRVLSEDRLVSLDIERVVEWAAMNGNRVVWATLCSG